MKYAACLAVSLLLATGADAADLCQHYVKAGELPAAFKEISVSAIGPAKLSIRSDGKCTCNDMPTVQRHLGQAEPEGVNWACAPADAADAADAAKAR